MTTTPLPINRFQAGGVASDATPPAMKLGALPGLAQAATQVLEQIARKSREDIGHLHRAELVRLEMAIGDLLVAITKT
jgi:hypothetical protein